MDTGALLQELVLIRWLLLFTAVAAAVGALAFLVIAVNVVGMAREVRTMRRSEFRRAEMETLLASGHSRAAKSSALDWIVEQPHSAEAHWALAKAHAQLGELTEAKQVLDDLRRLAPDEDYRIDAWLDRLDSEFQERRPRPVP
ncbi:tetratricopeptide repeat protein [Arenimonas composti]|jgi:predicted Zn-dependent protease|uniref:Uncharacterized protein n=1 Tax=Arenimonas composti TR7-09 = DSM 18010 TaxID=1121013 RepID=A0A091C115_9GAMM|nr:tetratricopeptide repeat protein [Arenimonas composti]KFN50320.1 hypothetical protein P873_06490 [Arenimonas composti TR7-09 = DSM 18010]